jgi:hypothetical protein
MKKVFSKVVHVVSAFKGDQSDPGQLLRPVEWRLHKCSNCYLLDGWRSQEVGASVLKGSKNCKCTPIRRGD